MRDRYSKLFAVAFGCALSTIVNVEAKAETTTHKLTGNFAVVSDYRFRGLSQSYLRPAIQGGFDYAHASGWYLGNWNSSLSSNSYNNGAGLEMDFYGGHKFNITSSVQGDVGLLHYYYPGASMNRAPGTPTSSRYNNTELYAGLSWGNFNGKLYYALSNYFGLNSTTASYAYWSALPAQGSSRGTTYIDLNYNFELAEKLQLGLHIGRANVRNYRALSYTDYKISLSKEIAGMSWNIAWVGTNADQNYYRVGNSASNNPKRIGANALLLSVSKTF